ncbi:uncharacterized protein LOC127247631 [Andrographis paniculata]|uniref:uncharacterized protein LOC127247631 n=1 Tax=Andrographis paniculata TaxID=175694 RepID=UPI0021E8C7B2|nr:uncharacterized protein LOC127247631 [Andrographis paniculata]
MAAVRSASLTVAVATWFILLCPALISSAEEAKELASQVCRNTTDFSFCQDAIYADPRAPGANRVVLAYIAFGKAYANGTDTRAYIASRLTSGGANESEGVLTGMKNCLTKYDEAVQTLAQILGDLDSETYYELDKRSLEVGRFPAACEEGFKVGASPWTERFRKG